MLWYLLGSVSGHPGAVSGEHGCRRTTHPPQLDETVITRRDNQGQGGVEGHPVDTPIMTLQHELDNRISVSKHIGLVRVGPGHLVFKGERGGGRRVLLPQS